MAWQWKPAIFVHLIIFVVYFVFKSFNESWNPKCHGVKHHVQPNSLCSVIEYLSEVSLLRISFSSSSSSPPPPPPPSSSSGTLRSNDADDHKNVKKTIGLISKTTTLHVHYTFLYISFPSLHDYDVKMPNCAFCGGRKQATTKFYFCFWAWIRSLEIPLQEGSPTIDQVSG